MRDRFGNNGPAAFTLVELLVVMAVLAMLLTIVMPMFGRAMEISRSTKCKTNLHNLTGFLHTEDGSLTLGLLGGSVHTIPTSSRWFDFVIDNRLGKLLICPSEEAEPDLMLSLRNMWVRQEGGPNSVTPGIYYSNLAQLLKGTPVPDTQVGAIYQGAKYGADDGYDWIEDLNGGPLEDNQAFVHIATCAAFVITFNEETIDLTPLGHAPNWNSGSSHWITRGDPANPDWASDVRVRLTGQGYTTVNPTVTVYGIDCHYGMSNLVWTRNYLLSQLWLVEYSSDIMSLTTSHRDDPFDDDRDNGEILGRHFGFANYVTVAGNVVAANKADLEVEFENIDIRDNIFQTFGGAP